MNSKERIDAVINLDVPDRVPLGPLLDHFAARYCGITNHELMQNRKSRINAFLKTMIELGPWDMTFLGETIIPTLLKGAPTRVYLPGKELPVDEIHQFAEFEFLTTDDYDLLQEIGLPKFMRNVMLRLYPDITFLRRLKMAPRLLMEIRGFAKIVRKAGVEPAVGFILPGPLLEYFSLGRSMGPMCMDLFDYPEKVKAAGKVWAKEMTSLAVKFAGLAGIKRIFIGLARSSPSLISPSHFEEFVLPELEYIVNTIMDAGMNPLFHCDACWTQNFHFFQKFPSKKIILQLDGASDIFKAKEMLGKRMCIMGDVPASLLAFGEKDEVMDYCKRLINEVGKGGGFILSSGCSIPANAKPENVQAMYEAVEEWGYY
jgi:uroporphyrinogen-III decarboxylase